MQQLLVERFEEAHVVVGHRELRQLRDDVGHVVADGADGEHSHVVAVAQLAPRAHADGFQRATPVEQHAAPTGIAYDEGATVGLLRREHKPAQFVLVHRRGDS